MVVAAQRRLPGIRFEEAPHALREALPRMDIAAFAGFTSRGPVELPVAIEDPVQFANVFGEDASLAWDSALGAPGRGYLGPAVRAFFANGGRRCWVTRLAGASAVTNRFPLPGVVALHADGTLAPAYARAASPGSWSDGLTVRAAVLGIPIAGVEIEDEGRRVRVQSRSATSLAVGDCIRVRGNDRSGARSDICMLACVDAIGGNGGSPSSVQLACTPTFWREIGAFELSGGDVSCHAAWAPYGEHEISVSGTLHWEQGGTLAVDLDVDLAGAPPTGTLLQIDLEASPAMGTIYLLALETAVVQEGSPERDVVRIRGRGIEHVARAPADSPPYVDVGAEILTLEIEVSAGLDRRYRLSQVGLAAPHPRYWGQVPDDSVLYGARSDVVAARAKLGFSSEHPQLVAAGTDRFPLVAETELGIGGATNNLGPRTFLPILVGANFDVAAGRVLNPASALERDGLGRFDAELFLDAELADVEAERFMDEADRIRYYSVPGRALRGVHSILGHYDSALVEEATLIAVPDVAQPGWTLSERPEDYLADYVDDVPSAVISTDPCDVFQVCALVDMETPELELMHAGRRGRFALRWMPDPNAVEYLLQQSISADFSVAVVIDVSRAAGVVRLVRAAGAWYFRLQARAGEYASGWSRTLRVVVPAPARIEIRASEHYTDETLVTVQRALLRMCAGRGDLFAVLGLPFHYREAEAMAHAATLRTMTERHGKARTLSFGALYHPWIFSRDRDGAVRAQPPEGAMLGVYADRALARGGWIAPANERLSEVVALRPLLAESRWLELQQAQVNVIRHAPRGFLALAADTLSDEPEPFPVNVRRLLILLRRIASRHGAIYVFEPHSDELRRLVQRGFEAVMQELFERGAFAGSTPASSFRVVTDESINPRTGRDSGRFIVELRVAPALPLTFITLRLTQRGERLVVTEGR